VTAGAVAESPIVDAIVGSAGVSTTTSGEGADTPSSEGRKIHHFQPTAATPLNQGSHAYQSLGIFFFTEN
jgi:hypothetical protein